eukprot:m.58274 g.58274  ORF g.58274 m.58274 type:complete len:148 (-) comp22525_c0_seq1:423-866(-)
MAHAKTEVEDNAAELQFGEVFGSANAVPLLISEVQFILEARQNMTEKKEEDDGDEGNTSEVFQKTLDYAQRFGQFGNKVKVREVRKLLTDTNLHAFEQAQLGNLCPQDAEEAKALIPSLGDRIDTLELEEVIEKMQAYKIQPDEDMM